MAENDIKTKIVLEGEKEYRQALKDANRELKTLKSELKAETAELGKNATAQEKNAVKVKNLQKQIAEQEKVVKTYRKALEEVKEKYGDNAEEVAKWEQKLNSARATLANMKNDLDGVGESMKGMANDASMATVASKSAADAIGSLADIGGSIADSIEGIFTGMLSTVKQTIADVWADVVDLAARSNGLVDLAGFWNTDVTTIQKYGIAVKGISGSLEDLNSIVTKINAGDSKKIAELTGVSGENYKDQWEYAMAVMDAMSKMSTEQRNKAAFDIFGGRQATKAFDLLNDWQKMLKELEDVDQKGYGLSGEELQQMSDLYDQVNKLEASWKSLKDMATVKLFGSLSLDLTSNAQGILDGFLAYFNAEDDAGRDAAIQQIEENIISMFERVKQAIQDGIALVDQIAEDLKGSDDPAVQTIGKLMGGLADALRWFTEDNMHNVVTALEILAGFWLFGKGLKLATTIAELAANLRTLSFFKLIGGAASGGLGTMGETIGSSAGSTFLSTLASGLPGILTAVLLGLPILDMVMHPEKYNGGITKEQRETLDKMNAEGNLFGKEGSDALHFLFGEDKKRVIIDGNVDTAGYTLPTRRTPHGTYVGYDLTDEQRAGLESYWDYLRSGEFYNAGQMENKLTEMFGTESETLNKLMSMIDMLQEKQGWQGIEDLPANWWLHGNDNNEGITNENLSKFNSLPGNIERAVSRAVSNIRVNMDGQAVGNLVAGYVSANIAESIQ